MTDEEQAPEPTPEQTDPVLARADPALILDSIKTGVEALGVGYAIYKGSGSNEQPQQQAEPKPEPKHVILPSDPE
jgi:hypothetical protein